MSRLDQNGRLLMTRRMLAAGPLALAAGVGTAVEGAEALSAPPGGRIRFDVRRNGQAIGRELVQFHQNADALVVRIEVEMVVKLGPVTLFNYRHESTERWQGARFDSLESHTVSNGAHEQVQARRTDAGVAINATKRQLTAPATASPLTHWNPAVFAGPLFNPQTGALLKLNVARGAESGLELVGGRKIAAKRISVTGDVEITDWYDQIGVWAALKAKARDGSIIEFRRA